MENNRRQASKGELERIAIAAGGFFSAASLLVGTFPHFGEIEAALGYVPRPEGLASLLVTVLPVAIVGHGYIAAKAARTEHGSGLGWIIWSLALATVYAQVLVDPTSKSPRELWDWLPTVVQDWAPDVVLMCAYVAIHGILALGFWRMSVFAYSLPLRGRRPRPKLTKSLWQRTKEQFAAKHRRYKARQRKRMLAIERQREELLEEERRQEDLRLEREKAELERLRIMAEIDESLRKEAARKRNQRLITLFCWLAILAVLFVAFRFIS